MHFIIPIRESQDYQFSKLLNDFALSMKSNADSEYGIQAILLRPKLDAGICIGLNHCYAFGDTARYRICGSLQFLEKIRITLYGMLPKPQKTAPRLYHRFKPTHQIPSGMRPGYCAVLRL